MRRTRETPPMPNAAPNYRWDHIHLRSPDPEATAAWFERALGAQVIRSTVEGKPRIDLKLGGADVFIMPVAPGDKVNPPPVTPYQGLATRRRTQEAARPCEPAKTCYLAPDSRRHENAPGSTGLLPMCYQNFAAEKETEHEIDQRRRDGAQDRQA
jgi:catechol 2,3-dioxygenase-like lactoylglutathione lyase family enzyme